MDGLLVALAVVFVAELGDKSQLMALAFATRYRPWPVLAGITLATSAVHLLSVAVGHGLGAALPTGWIALVGAAMFAGFGFWTLRGDALGDADRARAGRVARSAVLAVTSAFFLAELGDKTMLATITLATQHGWAGVWVGSTVGMVAADALAIAVGRQLGTRLPERAVARGAAALFFLFGAGLAVDAAGELTAAPLIAAPLVAAPLVTVLDHHAAGWVALALGLTVLLVGALGRSGPRRRRRTGAPADVARAVAVTRALYAVATALGLAAPLLVGADVIDPIALFDDPGVVVVGAGLALLGLALLLAAQARAARVTPALATGGVHRFVRHPGLTGTVVAVAGTMVMVPTLIGVVSAVLLVVAVQVQVRAVREPRLSAAHGPAYARYAAQTGRFLPRVPEPRPAGLPHREHVRVG